MALTDHYTVSSVSISGASDTLTLQTDTRKVTISTLQAGCSLDVGGTAFYLPASKPLIIENANLAGMTLTFTEDGTGASTVTVLEHRGQRS